MGLPELAQLSTIANFLIGIALLINKRFPNLMSKAAQWKFPVFFLVVSLISGVIWWRASANPEGKLFVLEAPKEMVFNKIFRNEVVPLDGRNFSHCEFHFVTFQYKGERPFRLLNCFINAPIKIDTPPAMDGLAVLFKALGVIDTNKIEFINDPKREF